MKASLCAIVVDASIAQAAGKSEHPTSQHCRAFLEAIHKHKKCVCVFTPELNAEWKHHASRLSVTWKSRMIAKKRWLFVARGEEIPFGEALIQCAENLAGPDQNGLQKKIISALNKDTHLVGAAASHGKRVASLDEVVRGYLRACAAKDANLSEIVWVNPNIPDEQACEWVAAGAPLEMVRTLGFAP